MGLVERQNKSELLHGDGVDTWINGCNLEWQGFFKDWRERARLSRLSQLIQKTGTPPLFILTEYSKWVRYPVPVSFYGLRACWYAASDNSLQLSLSAIKA
jgi:hypothetical protein